MGFGDVLMVVVGSDLLAPDPAVVVIPLLCDYSAVPRLNPLIRVCGAELVLAARLISAARRARLRRVRSAVDNGDEITRETDVLMVGV